LKNTACTNRVLVAEADFALRSLFAIVLNDAGFQVTIAGSGQEVLNLLHLGELPNILILDVDLPYFAGLKILEHMRSLPGGRLIRVAAVTGKPIDELSDEAKLADLYVIKPVSRDDVVTLVQRLRLTGEASG